MGKKQYMSVIIVLLIIIGLLSIYVVSINRRSKIMSQKQTGQTQQPGQITQSSQSTSSSTTQGALPDKALRGDIIKINKSGDNITSMIINADMSGFNLGKKKRIITLNIDSRTRFYNLQTSSKVAPLLSPDKLKVGDTVLVEVSSSTKELIPKGQDTFTALKISR